LGLQINLQFGGQYFDNISSPAFDQGRSFGDMEYTSDVILLKMRDTRRYNLILV